MSSVVKLENLRKGPNRWVYGVVLACVLEIMKVVHSETRRLLGSGGTWG